ncbi:MAG: TetR/AcrR family transcriptional regulator [Pseudomonadota bacterium]
MRGAKLYDRTDLLDRAIELFRRQGFSGTSTAELVEALGVNRKSMYAEFGSKEGLFQAALERYRDEHLTRVLAPIEAPDADDRSIRCAFEAYARASRGRFNGLGCLMCNTAVERAALDPESGKMVAAYLARVKTAFRRALENAKAVGRGGGHADLDKIADFLTMSLVGVSALIRAKAPPEQVEAAARVAVGLLDTQPG